MEKTPTFEQSLNRLNVIVQQLQEGSVSLDDSLKLFEEGMELVKQCDDKLGVFEAKVKELAAQMPKTEEAETDEQN
jgi:exodeoxyribonuclease VII small subunit